MRPDFKAWPQLRGAIVRHSVLGAGDVLFVPEGWGLQAVSLEGSCMVASTYVDEHNVGRAEVSTGGPPDSEVRLSIWRSCRCLLDEGLCCACRSAAGGVCTVVSV